MYSQAIQVGRVQEAGDDPGTALGSPITGDIGIIHKPGSVLSLQLLLRVVDVNASLSLHLLTATECEPNEAGVMLLGHCSVVFNNSFN